MTRFTDLMYETTEVLREHAKILRQQRISVTASLLETQAQKILEALADRRDDLLSTEDVERILKSHDPEVGNHLDVEDVRELAASHETMRARLDTAESIADQYKQGCVPLFKGMMYGPHWIDEPCWALRDQFKDMTPDQVAWFEAHQ